VDSRACYKPAIVVVGVHLVGGIIGTLLIGFLASSSMPNAVSGLFYGGSAMLLLKQTAAAGAVLGYSFVVALAIALAIKYTIGIRVSPEHEELGIDTALHRDPAYELS
jgi:Amt family ammonium transporter